MHVCASCGRQNPDEARFCNACGHELASPARPRETRRTVTVVFCDVTGSTAMGERIDPESQRRVMTRYFEVMRSVIESHGGTVEKFIGDAVVGVFGVPRVHEDDALRAVRAVAEMRGALAALNEELVRDHGIAIEIRIGVGTGEVVAGEASAGENVLTGSSVNTAARLEQAAAPGEILIGEETYGLVRDAVVVEDLNPLVLKGKAAPVGAHRLVEVLPGVEGHIRRMDSPMVGRERPLRLLRETFEGTVADRGCSLFTILGPAGIGKTRLTSEFLAELARSEEGRRPVVLEGRCLPYGEGITFWSISEMLARVAGVAVTDPPDRVRDVIQARLGDAPDAGRVAAHLAALIGAGAEVQEVEAAWAVRRLFESLTSSAPVVAFFEDIHWAEPGLLDAIEHVADFSRDAPILLLCTARPEFFDARPGWGGGKLRATAVHLEPLDERESEELIANLLSHPVLSSDIRARIRAAAQGNPLFVEEILQMLLDEGAIVVKEGRWEATVDLATVHVPPAISALLAARLDRLSGEEREVIEAASVSGEIVERAAFGALVPGRSEPDLEGLLSALVRKDLVVPSVSDLGGGGALRFRHVLIRDAAYRGIPKERRAGLHETFAAWLEAAAGERAAELDELLGYHLEQAHSCRVDLGASARVAELAPRAAAALERAGYRARTRGDVPATVNLLARATRLRPRDAGRVRMLIDLMKAATEHIDRETGRWAAAEALAGGRALGNEALEVHARVADAWRRMSEESESWAELEPEVPRAIEVLTRLGDDRGLAYGWRVAAWLAAGRGARYAEGMAAAHMSAEHARAAGDRTDELIALGMQVSWTTWGPTPVEESLARCDEVARLAPDNRSLQAEIAQARASAEAMLGRTEKAHDELAQSVALYEDLGQTLNVAFAAQNGWLITWLAGDFAGAETWMRDSIEILQERGGDHTLLALHRMMMAQAICAQGRYEEAEAIARACEAEFDDPGDHSVLSLLRRVLGLVASARGQADEADRLSREALEIAARTDGLFDHAWTLIERGEILRAAGREADALSAFEQAVGLAERKGDLVTAAEARSRSGARSENEPRPPGPGSSSAGSSPRRASSDDLHL